MDENIRIKIEHEISRIEKLISDAKPLLDLCKNKEPDFIEITAAAQILHSFYNGIEGIVTLYFKNIGEKLPNDKKWHKSLFEMMFGKNTKGKNIFCNELKESLNEYLLLRHFIRHSYSSEFKWNEMKYSVNSIEEIWTKIKADLEELMNNTCEKKTI